MTTIGTVPADAVTNLVKIGSTSGVDHGGQVILAVGDDVWEGDRIHLKILIAVKRKNVGDFSAIVVFPNHESSERLSILKFL